MIFIDKTVNSNIRKIVYHLRANWLLDRTYPHCFNDYLRDMYGCIGFNDYNQTLKFKSQSHYELFLLKVSEYCK